MHLFAHSTSRLIPLAGAAGLMILASACASASPHQANATGAGPRHTKAAVEAASPAAPAASSPAPAASSPMPTASPTTGSPGTTGSAGSTPPAYTGPDFTTPQAAMAYLAGAYNSDDTTAMHAVTTPQAFTALLAMRPADANLQLESCTARAPGDYVCSFQYTYTNTTASGQSPQSRSAMAIVAPALNPGWYLYKFIYGCD
jgi:predicted lipid-binding transport protein (Tim44 family)